MLQLEYRIGCAVQYSVFWFLILNVILCWWFLILNVDYEIQTYIKEICLSYVILLLRT